MKRKKDLEPLKKIARQIGMTRAFANAFTPGSTLSRYEHRQLEILCERYRDECRRIKPKRSTAASILARGIADFAENARQFQERN